MISLDYNRLAWKEHISDRSNNIDNPDLLHFMLQQNQVERFKDEFRIKYTPEFFLIDHTGRIVSAHTWPPSSGGAARMIRKLLEQSTE